MTEDAAAPAPRTKFNYIGAPACFALDFACTIINRATGGSCYQVGSSLQRADFRDVDVRCMMDDESFDRLFGDLGASWERNPLWMLLSISVSSWLTAQIGLPVDFQFQRQSTANEQHKGERQPLGRFAKTDLPKWHGDVVHAEKYPPEV